VTVQKPTPIEAREHQHDRQRIRGRDARRGRRDASPDAGPAGTRHHRRRRPATGDDDGLGDAGKRALESRTRPGEAAERERDDLKRRLEELENASKSEHEKALAQAKKDGRAEVARKLPGAVRRSEVRAALSRRGPSDVLDLASRADEFAALKVNDEGEVQGLDEAVEAFKKATPDLFAKAPAPAAAGGLRWRPARDARRGGRT
jgi:hypothetical protein